MDIYVGNIPYTLSEDELKELFDAHGEVTSARIIKDRETGRSKGFGFVDMALDPDGETAIKELHGTKIGKNKIRIKQSTDQ